MDASRNPIEFIIGDGSTHDVKVAPDLIDGLDLKETKILCADKGYDSKPLREKIKKTQTKAYIPKKRSVILNLTINIWIGIYIESDI